jgi:hypothetical protein
VQKLTSTIVMKPIADDRPCPTTQRLPRAPATGPSRAAQIAPFGRFRQSPARVSAQIAAVMLTIAFGRCGPRCGTERSLCSPWLTGIAVDEDGRLRAVLRARRQYQDQTPRTETSWVEMRTSDPFSIVVFGRCRPGGHGSLGRDVARMPGQAFSPDVLGDEGAHLAQQRSPVASATR